MTGLLTAHEVVQRHGLSYQTLNYYTNLGLLHVAKRDGNQRLYGAENVKRQLQEVERLKGAGYPLRLIARLMLQGGVPQEALMNGAKDLNGHAATRDS